LPDPAPTPRKGREPRRECPSVTPTPPAETPAPPSRPPPPPHVAPLPGVSPATAPRVPHGSARGCRPPPLPAGAAPEPLPYIRGRPCPPGRVASGTTAAVVCEDACRVLGDPYFARLLWGVRRELAGRAPLVVLMAGRADEWRAAAGYLRGGQAEGVLLLGARRHHVAPLVQAAAGAPVVLAGRPLDDVALPYVDVDNLGGAQAAVRHLLASGRRRIGTIAGPADMGAAVDRLAGYRLAAREAGMGVNGLVCQGDLGRLS